MRIIGLTLLLLLPFNQIHAQNLKPYVLGFETTKSISDIKEKLEANLEQNNIKVVGQYQPANDKNRWVLIFTSTELENAVNKIGSLTGFAATLRVGITNEKGKTIVTYTNPVYWGNAYFRSDFDKVFSNYTNLNNHLESAMKASGSFVGTSFGSEHGLAAEDLQKYRYMIGMPRFDNTVELDNFSSYSDAVAKIESAFRKGVPNLKKVYKLTIPGKELTLFGCALSGANGEGKFLPIIDIGNPKHTAFLPYEVLVMGNEVHILHGRYRIALSFPDLTMGTFSKIMSTPGNIEDLLEQLVK